MRARRMVIAGAAVGALGLGLACSSSGGTALPGASPAGASPQASGQTKPPRAQHVPHVSQPPAGLTPAELGRAYNLGPLRRRGIDGARQTIVVVDSFGSPTIVRDLTDFDAAFSLPAPPSLRIIQPAGPVAPYQPTSSRAGWASETTLDVEWAHAMAPGASILLVETPTAEDEGRSGFPQIVTAEQYVIRHHLGQVISQSFGATEETFRSAAALKSLRAAYQLAAEPRYAVTVLAASGDAGASGDTYNMHGQYTRRVVEWPASDPLVTAVGGTQLKLGGAGQRLRPDVAWGDGGGGRSADFARPAYQDSVMSVVGARRGIPDISMNASCSSSVAVYATYAGNSSSPWQTICGTSMATPLMAGVVALADQLAGHSLGLINPAIYQMAAAHDPGIVDVTSGGNTVSFTQGGQSRTVLGFTAAPGYDLASGVGTVNAAYFVPELARLAG